MINVILTCHAIFYIFVPRVCQLSTYLEPSQWSTRAHTVDAASSLEHHRGSFLTSWHQWLRLRLRFYPAFHPAFFCPEASAAEILLVDVAASQVTVLVLQNNMPPMHDDIL